MVELSPTAINMYLRCQLQFEFRYLRGIKVPPSSSMITGRSVHKALEENFKQKTQTFADLHKDTVLDIYSDAFEEYSSEVERWEEDRGAEKDKGAKVLANDYKLQLSLYALKNDTIKAQIHYLIKDKSDVVIVDISTEKLDVIGISKSVKEQIKAGYFVPTGLSHQWACNYCGYREMGLCPYGGGK